MSSKFHIKLSFILHGKSWKCFLCFVIYVCFISWCVASQSTMYKSYVWRHLDIQMDWGKLDLLPSFLDWSQCCSWIRIPLLASIFVLYFSLALSSLQVLLCLFPIMPIFAYYVCCDCDPSYIVSVHIECQASIFTLLLCRGYSWRIRLAKQETLTPSGHLVSPLVCRGLWMSSVVLYC